jgi:hypothetical protein
MNRTEKANELMERAKDLGLRLVRFWPDHRERAATGDPEICTIMMEMAH